MALTSGLHHFEFIPSNAKYENINNLKSFLSTYNDIGLEYKGKDWVFQDNSYIDYWQPTSGKPIYLYSNDIDDEPEYKLIGFVNHAYYDWFDYFLNEEHPNLSILNLEFDPYDMIVYFSILKD